MVRNMFVGAPVRANIAFFVASPVLAYGVPGNQRFLNLNLYIGNSCIRETSLASSVILYRLRFYLGLYEKAIAQILSKILPIMYILRERAKAMLITTLIIRTYWQL